ncbi:MAG: hypothetical protein HN919_19615 [Verrucomicrobia bacterium]|nr:hypothetical protein [Verrucomicrobiota bacterium]MBT7068512.1 hypothetical protein [Verrucomicrobiota bacterium]MBT7701919.1 hypothetical protein [Verrucomicrobiota bacterium]
MQGLYAELVNATRRPEDASLHHVEEVLSVDQVLDELAGRLKCERGDFTRRTKGAAFRPFTARYLTRYAGLTQRGVADILGVSTGVAVSLQFGRFDELVAENPKLRAYSRPRAGLDPATSSPWPLLADPTGCRNPLLFRIARFLSIDVVLIPVAVAIARLDIRGCFPRKSFRMGG